MVMQLEYNAHVSGLDALWAGLPLVTCPGVCTNYPKQICALVLLCCEYLHSLFSGAWFTILFSVGFIEFASFHQHMQRNMGKAWTYHHVKALAAGVNMARRCGASFLTTANVTQTVARTPEDYVEGQCVILHTLACNRSCFVYFAQGACSKHTCHDYYLHTPTHPVAHALSKKPSKLIAIRRQVEKQRMEGKLFDTKVSKDKQILSLLLLQLLTTLFGMNTSIND
jgi:hypothetical protein